MNRGAGRLPIFQHDNHRAVFLELLRETHEMFKAEIHAYCLMGNHYHLLIRTPSGNLGRVMRHLNGVYTQRYNRLEKTDGPLFRGRYKAILVDADSYLLNVSRYIHLNPVAAGMVKKAAQYPWSSYPVYIGKTQEPFWLTISDTLSMTGQRQQKQRYQSFVEQGIDQDTEKFYGRKKLLPILGSEGFVNNIMKRQTSHQEIPASRQNHQEISLNDVVRVSALVFSVPEATLYETPRGRGQLNTARSAAMYIGRKYGGHSLNEIAEYFGLNHYGSVSGAISRFDKLLVDNNDIQRKVERVLKTVNKQT
jgi:REP element-mobilizing transposase RayT